ncbi:MAG: hypothetical protein MK110_07040 [Fuerstiella sp.]|nr:hypothetical protein [Fuerstiella sp.]
MRFSRREWMKTTGAIGMAAAGGGLVFAADREQSTNIASRRELFVEDSLIARITGGGQLALHQPEPREVSLVTDRSWEGATCAYMKVFRDGDIYRMYYRGSDVIYTEDGYVNPHPETACYAESTDGIHWTRPNLGLFEFEGSKNNNIIWKGVGSHNFAPFLDERPECPAEEKFKALAGDYKKGLQAFVSADGVAFKPVQQKPVIAKGAFDSLNLAFWDSEAGVYREFHRDFRDGRDIRTGTSDDFVHWTDPEFLSYRVHRHRSESADASPVKDGDPDNRLPGRVSQLYTNQVIPYYRAPHVYLGFPTRYIDRGWTWAATQLPQYDYRKLRGAKHQREGTAVTDGMFMASRDAKEFYVWPESFIRPGLRKTQSWFYGDTYQNHGLVETKSHIEDAPPELSVYVSENSHQHHPGQFRRYVLRIDGFVSMHAPLAGGELVTTPVRYEGNRLSLNVSTSAAGSVKVEIQNPDGSPVPGYSLAESHELYGDSLNMVAAWKDMNADVGALAGQSVRLRFVVRDGDVFSYRFEQV